MATAFTGTEENNNWKVVDNTGKTLRHTENCPRGTFKRGEKMNHFRGFKEANEHAKVMSVHPHYFYARAVRV